MESLGSKYADYVFSKLTESLKTKLITNSSLDFWKTTLGAQAAQTTKLRVAANTFKCEIDELKSDEAKLDFNIRVEELYQEQFPEDDGTKLDIPSDIDELDADELTAPIKAKNSKKEASETTASEPSTKPKRTTAKSTVAAKPAVKGPSRDKEVVDEDEDEASEEETKPTASKAKPAAKKVVDEDEDDISEEDPKPQAPTKDKTTSKAASKAKGPSKDKKAEEEPDEIKYIKGYFDYSAVDIDEDVVNALYEAIQAVIREHAIDTPPATLKTLQKTEDGYEFEEHNSKYERLGRYVVSTIEGIDVKIQSSTIIIKFKISYVDDDAVKTMTVSVKYIVCDEYEAVAELTDEEQAMYDAFKEYLEQVKPADEKSKWSIANIEPAIMSDAVFSHKSLIIKGILDTTRNIPIGPYEMAYNIEQTDAYRYREKDYSKLFEFMRRTAAHYSPANLIKAMTNTYKNRHLIVYHTDVIAHIDKWWQQAVDALADESYNEDAAALKWRAILASPQCKLILTRGWPARAEFDAYIKELIKYQTKADIRGSTYHKYTMPTLDMMCGPLFSISFIFGPFAVALKVCPVDEKTRSKFPGATVDRYTEALGIYEARYADCNWCMALLQGLENDDLRSLRAVLLASPKHLGTKTGK